MRFDQIWPGAVGKRRATGLAIPHRARLRILVRVPTPIKRSWVHRTLTGLVWIVPVLEWGIMSELVQLEMPDGQFVWAMIEPLHGPSDVGVAEAVVEKLHGFHESLCALAVNARSAVAAAKPHEATVEFGLELSVGKDGVFAALVGAGGKAAVKVSLKWTADQGTAEPVGAREVEQGQSTTT
jgi:hypothetical protein